MDNRTKSKKIRQFIYLKLAKFRFFIRIAIIIAIAIILLGVKEGNEGFWLAICIYLINEIDKK